MSLSYLNVSNEISHEQMEYIKNKYGSVRGTTIDYKGNRFSIYHSFLGTPKNIYSKQKTQLLTKTD